MEHLLKIDILGLSHSFYMGRSSNLKTVQGALLSALIFCISGVAIWFFGEKLVMSDLSSSTFSQIYKASPRAKTNEDLDFSFFFGIQNRNIQHVYRPDIVDVTFDLITRNKDFSTKSFIRFPTHPCESEDFHGNAELFEKSINFKNTYCIKAEDTHKFALNSTFGFDSYTYMKIGVQACNNSTSTVTCAPQEEIDSFLEGFYFDFGYVKDIIDPTNYSKPASKEFDDFFGVASKNYYKGIYLYFKNIIVSSDTGWIIENKEESSFFTLGSIQETLDLKTTKQFLIILFRLDKEEDLITRKYYKLQDFLAQTGGVIKALMIGAKLIYSSFCKKKMIMEAMGKETLVGNFLATSKSNNSAVPVAKPSKIVSSTKEKHLTNLQLYCAGLFCWNKSKATQQYKKTQVRYAELLDIKTYLKSISRIEALSIDK